MPYVYVYQCRHCSFDLEISLSREFERTLAGERRDFDYPNPDLVEWPPRRVVGLWSRLWCPRCREGRSHIVVELEGPAEHPVQAFLAAEARGCTGADTGPCEVCGATLLVELEAEQCPNCAEGELVCIGEYEP